MMRKIDRIWFGVLVALSIVLIGVGNTRAGTRFQIRASSAFSPLSVWASFLFSEFKIRRENRVFRHKLTELSLRNQSLRCLEYENERLRDLVEFEAQEGSRLICAPVIGRDPDPISGICLIGKGAADGIKEGLPVMTPDGVYGRVIEVTEYKSLVETIFNFNFRVATMDLRSGVQGIVTWDGGKACLVAQVPVNSDTKVGDNIVTSDIGSTFPKGLNVGRVKDVTVDETRLFYDVSLEPACKFSRVEHVCVMTEFESPESERDVISETLGWGIYRRTEAERSPADFEIPEPAIRIPK
jgi:rod shape-determining protein MreC